MTTLSPWDVLTQNRDYRRVWVANVVSDIGTWMQLLAVSTLVASRTGSAFRTALVAAATFAPQLVSAPIGGVLADRYDRRKLYVGILGLQTISASVLMFAVAGSARSGVLTLIVLAQGIVGSMANPVFAAMTPQLVGPNAILASASLGSVSWNAGRITGPILATLIIEAFGPTWCIAGNAVSYTVLLVSLATLRRRFPAEATDHGDSVLTRVRQGVRALRETKSALFAYRVCIALQISMAPIVGMIPIYATKVLHGNSRIVSALYVSVGVGSLLGSVAVTAMVTHLGRARAAVALFACAASLLLVLSMVTSTLAAVIVAAPLGAAFISGFVVVHSVIMRDSPAAERGRIASIFSASIGGCYGVGVIWMGLVADAFSVPVALRIGAIAALIFLALSIGFASRQWRSIGKGDVPLRRGVISG